MTSTSERDHDVGMQPVLTDEQLAQLYGTYERALDEYSQATSAVYERIRRRTLPTAEEFTRKRLAQSALVDARRAFWKATRQRQRVH